MEEAKKGQIIVLKSPKIGEVEAVIESADKHCLNIYWLRPDAAAVNRLKEGDKLFAAVHTSSGVKNMSSIVVCAPVDCGKLVVENARALPMEQKREYVRVYYDSRFFIKFKGKLIGANTLDISGGGVRFVCDEEQKFALGDEVKLKFLSDDFDKDLTMDGRIINIINNGTIYVASYVKPNEFDRDKIIGFCIRTLAQKNA